VNKEECKSLMKEIEIARKEIIQQHTGEYRRGCLRGLNTVISIVKRAFERSKSE
jgi:hypothetical protein